MGRIILGVFGGRISFRGIWWPYIFFEDLGGGGVSLENLVAVAIYLIGGFGSPLKGPSLVFC